ncbi:helix-turn-helix domain-containing protein [Flavobacterium sp. SM15]|uniref:helix-turn-helix domain-containing protein n=1 Tax=Flavobacterium sp. SM15 TaxID=2908005 RepID=UPI001ED9DC19|nr:helix-turn-helix domain-containing protein [Flavobacterium sp. SM15]MCG2610022.1 helix-turn-helix domain-containing protein [Flavobacterium sp. SM15]
MNNVKEKVENSRGVVTTNNVEDVMLTRKEVAKFLSISLVTLNNHKNNGILKPSHKVGRRVLYSKQDLLKQIELSKAVLSFS